MNFFGIAVIFLIIAIILFIIEAQQSHYALNLHIKDLRALQRKRDSFVPTTKKYS